MNNKTETKTALEPDSLSAGINKTKKFIMASATDMNEFAEQEKAKAAAILKQKVAIIAWVILVPQQPLHPCEGYTGYCLK